jgi:hypothetical protein
VVCQPGIQPLIGQHALGALVDHQADEAAILDRGRLLEGVAFGAPATDNLAPKPLKTSYRRNRELAKRSA